ncbi:MAG: MSMEG_0572 family nitrogen starvation response protein [Pseudonocardia sp.]|nr:MSMEG_0572 family nitrogen starvation response protein [Pseudonocardia sp.]
MSPSRTRSFLARIFSPEGEPPAPAEITETPVPAPTAAEPASPSGPSGLSELEAQSLAEIPHPSLPEGSSLYGGTKVFADVQAKVGESYFTLVHGIAHESSVSFVAVLQATRALRKGYESALYFYGPGTMNCMATRGFPTTGTAAFPGELNLNTTLATFLAEGGTVYCCRFGLSLHGLREEDLIAGVIPTHPLDVQDALIHYARKGAVINSTYQL